MPGTGRLWEASSTYSSVSTFKTESTALKSGIYSNSTIKESATDVYPNPATNYITVKFNAVKKSAYQITLSDLQGKILLHIRSVSTTGLNKQSLNVSKFAPGIYMLRVQNENTINIKRILNSNVATAPHGMIHYRFCQKKFSCEPHGEVLLPPSPAIAYNDY